MGLLAIVAIASVMGISFTSADAAGKEVGKPIEFTDIDTFNGSYLPVCGVDNTVADILFEATVTTWPDKNMQRIVIITTGEVSDLNGNVVAELKGKQTFEHHSEGNGVSQVKLKLTAKCSDGGSEKITMVHNVHNVPRND